MDMGRCQTMFNLMRKMVNLINIYPVETIHHNGELIYTCFYVCLSLHCIFLKVKFGCNILGLSCSFPTAPPHENKYAFCKKNANYNIHN